MGGGGGKLTPPPAVCPRAMGATGTGGGGGKFPPPVVWGGWKRAPEIAGPLTRVGPEIMEPAITGPLMTGPLMTGPLITGPLESPELLELTESMEGALVSLCYI